MNKKNIAVGGAGHNSLLKGARQWINNLYSLKKIKISKIENQLQTEVSIILTTCYDYNENRAKKLIENKSINELEKIKALLLQGNNTETISLQEAFNKNKNQPWKKDRFYD